MHDNIAKAYAISDAKISFVSLVGKAANKHKFLIAKSEDGKANFTTYGNILKADSTAHLVTGIVYEPMVEDTDGNYMTEEEITKAAHWFAKNGNQVDLQHSFEPLKGAVVVESSVTKCDMELEGQSIKKGTWLMTVELQDEAGMTYKANILAGGVAAVLSVLVGVVYIILAETALNDKLAVILIALVLLSWLSAMVGYDKVMQAITQIKTA